MKKYATLLGIAILLLVTAGFDSSCTTAEQPQSASGVGMTSQEVKPESNGRTVEQNKVAGRLAQDNAPGSIKHLYIISAYSGQVILYSTVKGKVTSSGKRLTPKTVSSQNGTQNNLNDGCGDKGMAVWIGKKWYCTQEVIQDDGTFGDSVEYIYWFDSKDIYHQQYITGGMILHVSSEPIAVKGIMINVETRPGQE